MNPRNYLDIFYQKISTSRHLFRLFFINRQVSLISGISLFLNLAIFAFFLVKIGFRTNIPLHYNVYFGIDLIGNWYQLLIIPLFGFLIICLNNILAAFLYLKDKLMAYFLVGTALFVQIILFLATLAIVWLNT